MFDSGSGTITFNLPVPKPDKPEKLQLDCGSGFTAMRVSDSSQSRWNRSHKDDPVF